VSGGFLLVIPSLQLGGAERVMLNLARGLADAGEHVTLIVLDASGPLRREVERDANRPELTFIDLDRVRVRTAVLRLVRKIRSRRPDIIISSHTHLSSLLVAIRPLLKGARLVAREPGMWIDGPRESLLVRWVRRSTHRRIDLVLASSTVMQDQLHEILGRPIEILPNPVDVTGLRDRARNPDRTAGEGRRVVCVSRLAAGKGVEELVRMFVAHTEPADRLILVGDGPLRSAVEQTIVEVGAAGRVLMTGALDDPAPLIAGADAVVVPSRSEGMPNVVLEALALGTPVIATSDLTSLEGLMEKCSDGAVRLVSRSELGATLASVRVLGTGPRPTLLPDGHEIDNVVRQLRALLNESTGISNYSKARRLRILMPTLSPYPSALASTVQSVNMAQALAEIGHEVRLVAANGDPGLANVIGDTDPTSLYGFSPAFDAETLTESSYRGQSYLNAMRIARIARRWRPDLMLSRDLRACLIPARRGISTIYEVHSLTSIEGRQDRWVIRQLVCEPSFIGVLAISAALAEDLAASHEVPRNRIFVAHDAVRPDSSAMPQPRARTDEVLRVGYTGSLFAGRGIELLVDVAGRAPWIELHLVGGPAAAAREWQRRLATMGPGRVVVHGMVTPARAREVQQDVDVLVAPFARRVITDSGVDTSRWMSPMKVFEYMASGRPIIISDLPVLREVLRPGIDALMIPPEDPKAMIEALERLRNNPALGARLAASAWERAQSEFTWEARAHTVLKTLRRSRSDRQASQAPDGRPRTEPDRSRR